MEREKHSDSELPVYFRLIEIRAKTLVRKPLESLQIEAWAKALLERGELSGEMVKEAIVGVAKGLKFGVHV